MRIAIVHDALCVSGGAERLVLWMAKAFPHAPIFTSVYLPNRTFKDYRELDVRTLPLSRFIRSERQFKLTYPLWLSQIQRVRFEEYDVVLSSSTYLAKFIRPAEGVRHVCYLYAPFRLLWKPDSYTAGSLPTPGVAEGLVKQFTPRLQDWDRRRTRAIHRLATSCLNMANEIKKVYDRDAEVLYPPVEVPPQPATLKRDAYYLSVSRLISHKRVDLVVEACTRLKKQLVVVGDGPERQRLEAMAGETVRFAGRVSDEQLADLYRCARALVFPSYEDYGIVPLEAQAWGVPVVAYGRGGSLETIQAGSTGIFFDEQTTESVVDAILKFETMKFNEDEIRKWVRRFDPASFITGIRQFVLPGEDGSLE